jgi:hypothetical protein
MMKQLDKNSARLISNLNLDRLKDTIIGRVDISYMSGKKSKEITL